MSRSSCSPTAGRQPSRRSSAARPQLWRLCLALESSVAILLVFAASAAAAPSKMELAERTPRRTPPVWRFAVRYGAMDPFASPSLGLYRFLGPQVEFGLQFDPRVRNRLDTYERLRVGENCQEMSSREADDEQETFDFLLAGELRYWSIAARPLPWFVGLRLGFSSSQRSSAGAVIDDGCDDVLYDRSEETRETYSFHAGLTVGVEKPLHRYLSLHAILMPFHINNSWMRWRMTDYSQRASESRAWQWARRNEQQRNAFEIETSSRVTLYVTLRY